MTLDAASVGARIVVRHETGGTGPSGGPEMNDVIGHVTGVDDTSVTLELRDGRTTAVALSTVVTWKTVPPRPLRRRRAMSIDPDDLTRITSRGWPAMESALLGEWELRSSSGFTGRANSVAVHGSPGLPFGEALDVVRRFYRERAARPLVQVVAGSSDQAAFLAAGWIPLRGHRDGAVVQVADLEPSYVADSGARVLDHAADDWLSAYGRLEDEDVEPARAVMEGPAAVGFVAIGEPAVAIGRVVVTGEWAGLSAVEVDPAHRRRGLARRIVETSLAWAVERGADKAYLQTMRANTAAMALYEPYGFTDHHDYRYLEPPHTGTAQP